jgi:hypothetical protein
MWLVFVHSPFGFNVGVFFLEEGDKGRIDALEDV